MDARDIVAQLQQYRGRFSSEADIVDRFIILLKGSAPLPSSCFYRNYFTPGHCCGSAWIIDPLKRKTLLMHHKKLGKWLQPGGHADGEMILENVALREAIEETGAPGIALAGREIFDLDIHTIPPNGAEPEHLHFDARFLLVSDSTRPLTGSGEAHEVRWVPLDSVAALTSEESVLRMVRKTATDAGSAGLLAEKIRSQSR